MFFKVYPSKEFCWNSLFRKIVTKRIIFLMVVFGVQGGFFFLKYSNPRILINMANKYSSRYNVWFKFVLQIPFRILVH